MKPTKSQLEAAAKAAHDWLRWNHVGLLVRYDLCNQQVKRKRRALARAVLRAAGRVR